MVGRSSISALVALVLLVAVPASADAARYTINVSPASPIVGQTVQFEAVRQNGKGEGDTFLWRFGDGGTAHVRTPTHSYAAAGSYEVSLTVSNSDGESAAAATTTVVVRPAPPPPPPPPPPLNTPPSASTPVDGGSVLGGTPIPATPGATRPVAMLPFPVVRIAGLVLPGGAAVRILSVRTPRGSTVRVRCHGRSCPVGSTARTAAVRLVRLRRFERMLPAGTRLELFVRQRGKIGKYTRFAIRAGKPPTRVDRCLMPGLGRPVRCS